METCITRTVVGHASWTTGFVACTTNLFDEVRKNPLAVFNRLCRHGEWKLAEWVLDNFL